MVRLKAYGWILYLILFDTALCDYNLAKIRLLRRPRLSDHF